jgi:drug/metabolite transporter (DMT)-like permease
MSTSTVTKVGSSSAGAFRLRLILAFGAIYFLWGTTFLAIRILVGEVPPLFAAGARFFTAGVLLYGFMRLRGKKAPTGKQWRNLGAIALLMFVIEYGALFWGEKYVPSGISSVLAATIPILTLVVEMLILRKQKWSLSLVVSTVMGFAGVGVLLLPSGREHFPVVPALVILIGCVTWALGSVVSRSMDLPQSRPLTAGATMLAGGAGLFLCSWMFGEMHPFPHLSLRSAMALVYLIVAGSLLAYTAYVWLLAHMPATRVSSYAYVNPIVAVALGHFAGGESITLHTLAGTGLVVLSVGLILRSKK